MYNDERSTTVVIWTIWFEGHKRVFKLSYGPLSRFALPIRRSTTVVIWTIWFEGHKRVFKLSYGPLSRFALPIRRSTLVLRHKFLNNLFLWLLTGRPHVGDLLKINALLSVSERVSVVLIRNAPSIQKTYV